MFSYEQLDAIADAYCPLMGLMSLGLVVFPLQKKDWKGALKRLLLFLSFLLLVYGLMFTDQALDIWPRMGLDYSTHAALALACVCFLSLTAKRLTGVWGASFVAYAGLMLYQRYHTLADVLTTAIVVLPLFWLALQGLTRISAAADESYDFKLVPRI